MSGADLPMRGQTPFSFRSFRYVGTWLCLLIAAYFAISAVFAIVNFERYGTATPQFLRYILIPAAIVLVYASIPFLLQRRHTLLTAIYSLSILSALFLSEAFLTARMIPVLFGSLGQLSDEQRRQIEEDDKTIRGFTLAYLNAKAEVESLQEAKLSGFAGMRTVLCSQPEGALIYRADRYGFNNPDDVYDGDTDVMVVGDSFTEGFCLPAGEDFVASLRQQGASAVSMGIRGNGPMFELAAIGRFGPNLRPDHVIMAFFEGNDWKNLEYELTQPWLRRALEPDAEFGEPAPSLPETDDRFWAIAQKRKQNVVTTSDLLFRTAIFRNFFALQKTGQALGIIYPKVPAPITEFPDVLRSAKSVVEAWGGTFSLLYIPDVGRYRGLLPTGFAYDQLRQRVLDAAENAGIGMIDLTPTFDDEADARRFYAANGHFSEEGADVVAGIIAEAVRTGGHQDRLAEGSVLDPENQPATR
jgi:hypothetical protein